MEAGQDAAGFGPQLRRRLLHVRMRRLLRGRVAAAPWQFVPFPRTITRVAFGLSQMWPDREPESLRRPPKSFI